MELVRSALGDDIDSRALRSAVFSREALRADVVFLNSLERKLHHHAADRVVLVVDAIDGDVHVAATVAIDREDRVPILGRIVGVCCFHAGCKIGEVGRIAASKGRSSTSLGVMFSVIRSINVDEGSGAGNLYNRGGRSRTQRHIDCSRLADEQLRGLDYSCESLFRDLHLVVTGLQQIKAIGAGVVGGRGASETGGLESGYYLCTGNDRVGLILVTYSIVPVAVA